ncbi:MAG: hopanoid biosynthesis-associated protein HpnK [Verrucomicrobia bacterium]|nr:hopanoid biosynthesis-associated protein HpnK [Verrucomicrobiota bacterium]
MAAPDRPRRLIVNADDFGRSSDINAAVLEAHRTGILTSASLMVNEPAAAEAIALARAHPSLGVGLHLVLVAGRAALPPDQIPDLVNARGVFPDDAVRVGFRLFFLRRLRDQLEREIAAQFRAFAATGLALDHVNGHLNLHLHPTVFSRLHAGAPGPEPAPLRWTRDPFWLNARLARGRWGYRVSHAVIFRTLTAWARPRLRRAGARHTERVFGLLQNGQVDEPFLAALIERLPPGDSEVYAHPSLSGFLHEFEALVSPRIRAAVVRHGIRLIRYQDL